MKLSTGDNLYSNQNGSVTNMLQYNIENSWMVAKSVSVEIDDNENAGAQFDSVGGTYPKQDFQGENELQSNIENEDLVPHSVSGNVQFNGVDGCMHSNESVQSTNSPIRQFNIEAKCLMAKLGSADKFQSNIKNSLDSEYGTDKLHATNAARFHIECSTVSTDKVQSSIENSLEVSKSGSTNVQFGGVVNECVTGNSEAANAQFHIESSANVFATKFASKSSTCLNVSTVYVLKQSRVTDITQTFLEVMLTSTHTICIFTGSGIYT